MKLTVAFVLTLWIALAGCGGSSSSTTATANLATGAWTEALTNTSGQQLGSFSFNMTQNNTTLSGSNMNFANMGSLVACIGDGAVMSGQMGPGMMKRRLYDDDDVMDTVRQYSYGHYDDAGQHGNRYGVRLRDIHAQWTNIWLCKPNGQLHNDSHEQQHDVTIGERQSLRSH